MSLRTRVKRLERLMPRAVGIGAPSLTVTGLSGSGTTGEIAFFSGGTAIDGDEAFSWQSEENGVDTGFLQIISTATDLDADDWKQMRIGYDETNYADWLTDSTGDVYIKATGGSIYAKPPTDIDSEIFIDADPEKNSILYLSSDETVKWSIYRSATNHDLRIDDDGDTRIRIYQATGNIGFGSSSEPLFWDNASLFLKVVGASGKQMRLAYDGSNYVDFLEDSSGVLNVSPTGLSTVMNGRNLYLTTAGANQTNLIFKNGSCSSVGFQIQLDTDTNGYFWNYESGNFYFGQNATERLRMASGLTTFNFTKEDQDFQVNGDTATGVLYVNAGTDRVGVLTTTPRVPLDVNGLVYSTSFINTFQARLQKDSTTQISLQRYKGNLIYINGVFVDPGSGGYTLSNTANLISSTGTDSGGAPAINTLYYVYVSSDSASFAASGIRMSATAPSLVNGVKYLGTSGNALEWRFVGYVKTISNAGTVNFVKNQQQCFVVNWYNRIPHSLFSCPAYDGAAQATYAAPATASWESFNGGTGAVVEFISNGEDAFPYAMHVNAQMGGGGTVLRFGVAENGQDTIDEASDGALIDNTQANQQRYAACVTESPLLPEGYSHLTMIGTDDGGGGVTIIANPAKDGDATSTPPSTYIRALVPA